MTSYTRGTHSMPVVMATDADGNGHNVQTIVATQVTPENGAFTVWWWRKGQSGRRWATGLNETDANTLAQSLVSRVA